MLKRTRGGAVVARQTHTLEAEGAIPSPATSHYARNKAAYIARARAFDARNREALALLIEGYKATHPCVDCGERDIVVLEFDHVRGDKEFNVGDARRRKLSPARVVAEMEKCEVRCANCHRRATHRRRLAR